LEKIGNYTGSASFPGSTPDSCLHSVYEHESGSKALTSPVD